jgi:flagellin FlaB
MLIRKDERGITGLETAIILIAFVVVAAVFAYTALSAGLFATQKSQEAVYSGLEEARSSLKLRSPLTTTAETTGASGTIKQLTFTVSNALRGEPIDFTAPTAISDNTGVAAAASTNRVVISYIDQDQRVDDLYWTITKPGWDDGDDLLEDNEKFQITIGNSTTASGGGNLIDALTTDLGPNKTFTIEVKTAVGAVLTMERTTPSYIDTIINLN